MVNMAKLHSTDELNTTESLHWLDRGQTAHCSDWSESLLGFVPMDVGTVFGLGDD